MPRPPPAADQPSAEPSAVELALQRLAALTTAGASPDAVTRAVGEIVAGWAGEADMDAEAAKARIEAMWDSATKDLADLEEGISDAGEGDSAGLALAGRMRAALRAAVRALAAAGERF